jgi:Rps23 Pro-64 3,4-dihydroxylase Tpa1-like proline 4-hydroxylase
MTTQEIFRPELFSETYMQRLNEEFCANKPIRHLVIDNFLRDEVAKVIYDNFPSLEGMNTHYKGLNEKKAEHSDFGLLHPAFAEMHEALSSTIFITWLQRVTGINALYTIEDRLSYGLHQGGNNSFLDIHIDYNVHPIKKLYRKLNFIFFVNPGWSDTWGGKLELWDKDVRNCIQSIAPIFNRCVIFECSDISYHGYNRISVPDNITRKSYYQYFFVNLTENISFHDTIFKPRPQESSLKKAGTYTKDFIKNTGKRILVKLGWNRFLK